MCNLVRKFDDRKTIEYLCQLVKLPLIKYYFFAFKNPIINTKKKYSYTPSYGTVSNLIINYVSKVSTSRSTKNKKK
jgi:hypothetical protein